MKDQNARLDLRGLKCPLPALFARRALARAEVGASIEVLSDDPLASVDLPYMCAREGYEVIESAREGTCLRIVIRKPL